MVRAILAYLETSATGAAGSGGGVERLVRRSCRVFTDSERMRIAVRIGSRNGKRLGLMGSGPGSCKFSSW